MGKLAKLEVIILFVGLTLLVASVVINSSIIAIISAIFIGGAIVSAGIGIGAK